MTKLRNQLMYVALGAGLLNGMVYGESDHQQTQAQRTTPTSMHPMDEPIVFVPKDYEGVPNHITRLMAAQRSAHTRQEVEVSNLLLLMPSKAALTMQTQPSLFWYYDPQTSGHPVKLTLNNPNVPDPIVELVLNADQLHKGINRLDLSRFNINLQQGVVYEWVATVVVDAKSPELNRSTRTSICRVRAPQSLAVRFAAARQLRQRVKIAADEGIWVDALAWISDLIDANPDDPSLRRDRANLLRYADFRVDTNSGAIQYVTPNEPLTMAR